jgi:penicillin amidase
MVLRLLSFNNGVEKIYYRRRIYIYGYMSFSFAMAQKSDPLMTDIHNKYKVRIFKDLSLDGCI